MLSRSFTRREQLIMAGLAGAIILGAGVLAWQRSADSLDDEIAVLLEPAATMQAADPPTAINSATNDSAANVPAENGDSLSAGLPPAPAPKLTVAIRGAVKYPGLYEIAEGRRVDDLLDRAGGTLDLADMRDINIAAPLIDGSTLTVPSFPDPETGTYGERAFPAHATLNPPQYTVSGWQPGAAGALAATGSHTGSASGSGGAGASGLIDLNRASQAELETLPGIGPVTAASIISYREQMPFRAVDELEQVSGIGPKRLEAVRDMVTVSGR
jgi:competence protein ComEA